MSVLQYHDNDRYAAHRVAQAIEAAHFIRLTSRAPFTLLLADCNDNTSSLMHKVRHTHRVRAA